MRTMSLVLASTLAIGCGGSDDGETIELGSVLSVTGQLAAIGAEQLQAASLAVDEINRAGGVLGQPLSIINVDDGSDAARAKTAAQTLVDNGVPMILGAIGSGMSLEVSAVTIPARVVQISASSTSPLLTSVADDGFLNRTCAPDSFQGKLLATRAYAKGLRMVAVIHQPEAYGMGLADVFATEFTALGGMVTSKEAYVENQSDYTDLLTSVFSKNPEAIVLPAYPVDGATIIKDYLNSFAARGTFWFFTDALNNPDFVTGVGASNFTFQHEATGPATPSGARYDAFVAGFTAAAGVAPTPGFFSAQAYDAVYLTAFAMVAANDATGAAIRDALPAVSAGGTAYGAREVAAAFDAAGAGQDIDYDGASGSVDLDANGDVVAPYDIWKVGPDGTITIIESSVQP